MNFLSLLLPFAYLAVLIGSLATFSSLYRRRQAAKAASLAPWFPAHQQRNIYLTLLELQSDPSAAVESSAGEKTESSPKIPDTLLKAALFRRAVEDIHRLMQLRAQKPALAQLLQKGSVGDELWQRFQLAEKEMELELQDVAQEAMALAPQQEWGKHIFQSASEAAHRENLTKKLRAIEATRSAAKLEWEQQKETLRAGFMKELDSEGADAPKTASSDEDAVLVETPGR